MPDGDASDRRHTHSQHAVGKDAAVAAGGRAPRAGLGYGKRPRGAARRRKTPATQPCPVRASDLLAAAVRTKGPDHPEALAAAGAVLAACEGIVDDPDEWRCEPSWPEVAAEPPPGAWCAACGGRKKRGGRWWRLRAEPRGWACASCRPPRDLRYEEILTVET